MNLQTVYQVGLILSAALALAAGIYALLRRPPSYRAFSVLSVGVLIWSASALVRQLSAPDATSIWQHLERLGADLLCVAWLAYVLEYMRPARPLSQRTWLVLLIWPVLGQIFSWLHFAPSLVGSIPTQQSLATNPTAAAFMGVWGWVQLFVAFGILVIGSVLLLHELLQARFLFGWRTFWLLAAMLAPALVYCIEINALRSVPLRFVTPFVYACCQVALVLDLLTRHFSVILPLSQHILASRQDGALVLDQNGKVIDLNHSAAHILEQPRKSLLGKPATEVVPGLMANILEQTSGATLQTGLALGTDETNGKYYDAQLYAFTSQGNHRPGWLMTLRDATLRRQLEQSLKDSEERYRNVMLNTQEGVMIHDSNGLAISCNPAAERIMGLSASQIMGRSPIDPQWQIVREDGSLFPKDEQPMMVALRSGVRQTNIVMGIQKPDKSLTWVQVNAHPVIDLQGIHPHQVVSTYVDITNSLHSAQEQSDVETKVEALMEIAPLGIIISNSQGIIQSANKHAEEMFGYTHSELVGEKIETLIPDRLSKKHPAHRKEFLAKVGARQMGLDLNLIALRKDGSEFPVEVGLSTIETGNGRHALSYIIDMSKPKSQELSLRQANSQLSATLAELGEHNRLMGVLNEMSEMLHSCSTVKEAQSVVAEFARQMFPEYHGALYQVNGKRNVLEASVMWGEYMPVEMVFELDSCWALRRSKTHVTNSHGLHCKHVGKDEPASSSYICIPMTSSTELTGMLHLRSKEPVFPCHVQQFATTMAEHISMAFSNLALRENLRQQAIRDPLTGLFNRRYMEEALEREIRRAVRHDHQVGLIMIDIDKFKEFNDTNSHLAGDTLLEAMGTYLLGTLRGEDVACRYGGEEFLIILPETNLENSHKLAKKLWKELQSITITHLERPLGPISVSLGVAEYPSSGRTSLEVLAAADRALYEAKEQGRNKVVISKVKAIQE